MTCSSALPRSAAPARAGDCWSSCCTGAPTRRRSSTATRRAGSRSERSGTTPSPRSPPCTCRSGSEALPIDVLVAESGSVPLAVHRVAAEWARARASAAIGASAGRAGNERVELRSAEAALSDDLLALGGLKDRARRYSGEDAEAPRVGGLSVPRTRHVRRGARRVLLRSRAAGCRARRPARGLAAAGRDRTVRQRQVVGGEGGPAAGARRRRAARLGALAPGAHAPGAASDGPARACAPASRSERAVIVVDQFEEVFTVCRDEARADRVPGCARRPRRGPRSAASRSSSPCAPTSTVTARSTTGSRGSWAPTRCWSARCAAMSCGVRSKSRHDASACSVEPSLTDALIADVLDQPGGLPLLSAALLEQWREREGRVMRRASYERTGGVRGAVGRLAEQTYASLSEPERRAARRDPAAAGRRRRARRRVRAPPHAARRARPRSRRAHGRRAGGADRQPARDRGRGDARGRARGAAARMAAAAWLARGGRRGAPPAPAPDQRGARAGRPPGATPGELYRGARLASTLDWVAGHDAGPERARARVPRREPRRRRARDRCTSGGRTVASVRCVGRPRRGARGGAGRRRRGPQPARRGP